ncbi:MAG: nucleoside monophosphate kinase [Minisyncoccia bacterium]
MLQTVIFIGRSGSGKGTQASLLMNKIKERDTTRQILYVETGDHYRSFVRRGNFSARLANEVYEKDELAPDFLGCWLWGAMLIDELDDGMHLVFDGAARTLLEAQVLTSALKFYKREKPIVIYIDVSNKWSDDRLLARGRADDRSLSKINKRLKWFDEQVVPAIEYFRRTPYFRLIQVSGEQAIEKVHADIMREYDKA